MPPMIAMPLVVAALLITAACTQDVATQKPTQLTGPDRMERLIAGAQAEGVVSVYSTVTVDDMVLLSTAFEEKYGVKVELWRGNTSGILQRATTEARAGRFSVDVIEAASSEMESIAREGLFKEISLPVYSELPGKQLLT